MEIKNKTVSVWLTLSDGENKGKVALQKRSIANESFPYICQSTWTGKVDLGELVEEAVERECEEELGSDFFDIFNFKKIKLISKKVFLRKGEKWESNNFVGKIKEADLDLAIMHEGGLPNFVLADKNNEIYSIKTNKNPQENIVLFDDQYNVIKKILKIK